MSGGVADDEFADRRPRVDHGPARASSAMAVVAAAVAVGTTIFAPGPGLLAGAAGTALAVYGLVRGARSTLGTGVVVLLLGVLLTAALGGGPVLGLLGAVAGVLVWDLGENAINVGEQVGRAADTAHAEFAHAAASAAFGLVTVAVGYGAYAATTGNKPLPALVLLLFGATVLTALLRR